MKRCLAGLCLLLMLLTACTARPSQTPVTAKDDAARRAWLEQQGWQTEHSPLGGTSCWWVFSSIAPDAVLARAAAGAYRSKFALAARRGK